MTARERLAPLAARLRAALADEKQRVNLLVCMGWPGCCCWRSRPGCPRTAARRAPRQPP